MMNKDAENGFSKSKPEKTIEAWRTSN